MIAGLPTFLRRGILAFAAFAAILWTGGCSSTAEAPPEAAPAARAELILHEGDVIKITFPGASDLNPPEPLQIRRDGKITLPIVGEISAAGLTPSELQGELLSLFSKQLVTKEVVVSVVSSNFIVFVDGDVVHPGKIVSDHPITLLDAIMEAGGFDYTRADPSQVRVIRRDARTGAYSYYTVNLKHVLEGRNGEAFPLATGDVVHVPEKFSWF